MKSLLLAIILLTGFLTFAQINGIVTDKNTNKPLFGVKIYASDGQKALSDFDGKYELKSTNFPITIRFNLLEYKTDTLVIEKAGGFNFSMRVNEKNEQTVVVSANKRAQKIEEIPISIEVIKPQMIDHKGIVNLEQAVEQTPGVFTMDGQVSIRGGSGLPMVQEAE